MRRLLVCGLWFMVRFLILFLFLFPSSYFLVPSAKAVVDPLSVPNNKFGIHIIQATPNESSPAASLVNTNGDWGYITVLIESKNRNLNSWQEFFNDLRLRHLIPIVRLATEPENSYWKKPNDGEEEVWAEFLNKLNWPIKNRYVVIYNEPNHATEWGGVVDAKLYAQVLDKTIVALKNKSEDFFVLNAGFDASAPSNPPKYEDQVVFMKQMNTEIPGIFGKLDGWVSHSYPNPEFMGSPDGGGRGTIRTWYWELQQLRSLGVSKILPVFITETGWQHAEGLTLNQKYPTANTVAEYFKNAYGSAWTPQRIVAVTPFLLSYQEPLFDHFSFKKPDGGTEDPYYPQFNLIKDLPKTQGKPTQINSAQLTKGEIYSTLVAGESYIIPLTFKNTGQSIWGEKAVKLVPMEDGEKLEIKELELPADLKIEPGKEYTFQISLKAPDKGNFKVDLQLFSDGKQFDSLPVQFETKIKQSVNLKVSTNLKWKNSASGEYMLSVSSPTGDSMQRVIINETGYSLPMEARFLLPDHTFEFSLERENYKVKTIRKKVIAGENILDFGELEPKLLGNILRPQVLWTLLPFSN